MPYVLKRAARILKKDGPAVFADKALRYAASYARWKFICVKKKNP